MKAPYALLAIVLSLSPRVSAQYLYYNNGSGITINGYRGTDNAVNIPSFIGGVPVTVINNIAFEFNEGITEVAIPDTVVSIENEAFNSCPSLTNVMIGNGVATIYASAFASCTNLTSVTIGRGVTTLGEYAFGSCTKLTNVLFTSNAPAADTTAFMGETPTVYYLPGTTGWGQFSTNAGVSVSLWNPSIVTTANSNFGLQSNQFGFTVTGTPNIPFVIAATTNLSGGMWTPLQSCILTNDSIYFSDTTNYQCRLYSIQFP